MVASQKAEERARHQQLLPIGLPMPRGGSTLQLVYPQISSTDLDVLWLLAE
jgi:hypothetical protein